MSIGQLARGRDAVFRDNLQRNFRVRLRSDCLRLRNGRFSVGVISEVVMVAADVETQTRRCILGRVAATLRLPPKNVNRESMGLLECQYHRRRRARFSPSLVLDGSAFQLDFVLVVLRVGMI